MAIINVSGAILSRSAITSRICSMRAGTSDISFRVLQCIESAATPSSKISGTQVAISFLVYPIRVLTETGIDLPASLIPSFVARIISRAIFGVLIMAAPAPCFSIDLSGQPILISIPSKPNSTTSLAASLIFTGLDENNCATIGLWLSVYSKSLTRIFLPAEHSPSAETNSVQNTSGFPCSAMIRRKAASVTSAIGANTKNGFSSFFQKPYSNSISF